MQTESDEITFKFGLTGQTVPYRWRLLESCRYRWPTDATYVHPSPPFSRMFLLTNGSALVQSHGHASTLLTGRLYLLPAAYSFRVNYARETEFLFFHFLTQSPLGTDPFASQVQMTELHDDRLFEEIAGHYGMTSADDEARWRTAVFSAMCRCLALQPNMDRQVDNVMRFRELLEYVDRNCAATLNVGQLANRMNLSRSALSKGFQRATGIALKDHLSNVLLQRIKERLILNADPIKQIAFDLRFTSVTYLFRFFKRYMDCTPAQYRTRVRLPNDAMRSNGHATT